MKGLKAIVSLLLVAAFSVTAILGQTAHFDVAGMDTKTSACADFYQYANGGWLAANPIPAAFPAWGVGNVLNEHNRDVLHDILEAAAKNVGSRRGSNEQKIGDYYFACMEDAKIEAEGLKPIQPELDLIKDQRPGGVAKRIWPPSFDGPECRILFRLNAGCQE